MAVRRRPTTFHWPTRLLTSDGAETTDDDCLLILSRSVVCTTYIGQIDTASLATVNEQREIERLRGDIVLQVSLSCVKFSEAIRCRVQPIFFSQFYG